METDRARGEALLLSLSSPFPNEHELALNIALLLSSTALKDWTKAREVTQLLTGKPALLNVLLAHTGFYGDCGLRRILEETYRDAFGEGVGFEWTSFWQDVAGSGASKRLLCECSKDLLEFREGLRLEMGIESIEEEEEEEEEGVSLPKCCDGCPLGIGKGPWWGTQGEDEEDGDLGGERWGHPDLVNEKLRGRVTLVAEILRNFSFLGSAARLMARSETMIRFLLVAGQCEDGRLVQIAFDIISNVLGFVEIEVMEEIHNGKSILYRMLKNLVRRTVIESGNPNLVVCVLEGMQVQLKSLNEFRTLEIVEAILRRLASPAEEGVMVIVGCLEYLYMLTDAVVGAGAESGELVLKVPGAMKILVDLVFLNSQETFEDSLRDVKLLLVELDSAQCHGQGQERCEEPLSKSKLNIAVNKGKKGKAAISNAIEDKIIPEQDNAKSKRPPRKRKSLEMKEMGNNAPQKMTRVEGQSHENFWKAKESLPIAGQNGGVSHFANIKRELPDECNICYQFLKPSEAFKGQAVSLKCEGDASKANSLRYYCQWKGCDHFEGFADKRLLNYHIRFAHIPHGSPKNRCEWQKTPQEKKEARTLLRCNTRFPSSLLFPHLLNHVDNLKPRKKKYIPPPRKDSSSKNVENGPEKSNSSAPQSSQPQYFCDWIGCVLRSGFASKEELRNHVYHAHCPGVGTQIFCGWRDRRVRNGFKMGLSCNSKFSQGLLIIHMEEHYKNAVQRMAKVENNHGTNVEGKGAKQPSSQNQHLRYLCQWHGCDNTSGFVDKLQLRGHVHHVHVIPYGRQKISCGWLEPSNQTRPCPKVGFEAAFSYHMEEHYEKLSLQEVPSSLKPRLPQKPKSSGPGPLPLPKILTNHSSRPAKKGLTAIQDAQARELALQPPVLQETEDDITKSVRLTSALVLRNLIKLFPEARRLLKPYEPRLVEMVMTYSECTPTVAQILGYLRVDYPASGDPDPKPRFYLPSAKCHQDFCPCGANQLKDSSGFHERRLEVYHRVIRSYENQPVKVNIVKQPGQHGVDFLFGLS